LHVGVSTLSLPLPAQFRRALASAESVVSTGLHLAHAETIETDTTSLRGFRRDLVKIAEETPSALAARFDGYLAAVAARSGYEPEPCRAHLEAALERITEGLVASGVLEDKGVEAFHESVQRATTTASTLDELFAAYRRTVADISSAVERPVPARHERSLRRAIEFLRQHYAERLTLKQVARVAGFAPNYFSELFHRRQRMTFASHLMQLRLQRAKELLAGTSLGLDRVAQLSGLMRSQHLIRVLRRSTGATPMEYRRRMLESGKVSDKP
jgi:YesN/AraC family two-component response regulator